MKRRSSLHPSAKRIALYRFHARSRAVSLCFSTRQFFFAVRKPHRPIDAKLIEEATGRFRGGSTCPRQSSFPLSLREAPMLLA